MKELNAKGAFLSPLLESDTNAQHALNSIFVRLARLKSITIITSSKSRRLLRRRKKIAGEHITALRSSSSIMVMGTIAIMEDLNLRAMTSANGKVGIRENVGDFP